MDRVADNLKVRPVLSVRFSSNTTLVRGQAALHAGVARAPPCCKCTAFCPNQSGGSYPQEDIQNKRLSTFAESGADSGDPTQRA